MASWWASAIMSKERTMKLFIAEKPSVAKCIIEALGKKKAEKGYFVAQNGDMVTWCFGHLLELAEPDEYLSDEVPVNSKGKKRWRYDDLPIFPKVWINNPKSDKGAKAQLTVIGKLLKTCTTVVNCGDPDREGQLLVDEVLEHFKCKKQVLRYICSAQDSTSVNKALAALQPNAKYQGMAMAARARQRADWLIGMNLSRAYTLASQTGSLIAIGRVQTPTLNLVAMRDLEIKNFVPQPYFNLKVKLSINEQPFNAEVVLEGMAGLDSEQRLVDATVAKHLVSQLKGASSFIVTDVTASQKEIDQPKSLSLADLQQYASSSFGLSAKKTLDICQSLYETHKLTTYPRSDCSYLPEVQHADAPQVLQSLAKVNPEFADLIQRADPTIKSKTWNDTKISAHHGIIPTSHVADKAALSPNERKIYDHIVKTYLAQFYPKCVISNTTLKISADDLHLVAKGSVVLKAGFREVLGNSADKGQVLPPCKQGTAAKLEAVDLLKEKTKAPARYTEGSLIRAMENIANTVTNPEHKKFLKEGDGIGTSATRAAIIEELKKKDYLGTKNKALYASDTAFSFLGHLPDIIKNPVLTAIYESKFKDIESGKMTLAEFESTQVKAFVSKQVDKAKTLKI